MSTVTLHSEKKKKLVPKLRFKEFNNEFALKKFGSLGEFKGGGTPSTTNEKHWKGNIPWISSSDIYDGNLHEINIHRFLNEDAVKESATKIIPANSILLVSRVGVGKLAINKIELCTSQDFCNFIPNKCNSYFVGYFLIAKKQILVNFSQGTSIKGFTIGDIKTLPIIIPSLPEQQKIASFLSAVDEKIQQLSRKKELLEKYKKGVMQKLFSGKLRFKDDNGEDYPDWEEKKLGEVANRVVRKNKENNLNVLTISAQLGLVSQLEYFNKSVSAKDVTKYYLLEKNDFAYNKSYSNGYPMGAIKRLKKYEKGVVSTLYICFCFNNMVSLNYMEQYFEFGLHNKEIEKVAQEGARNHGLLNIGVNDFLNISLTIPSFQEQQKIANFLSGIDTKIESTNKQITQTQTFKKGLLQQMFV
ncbi:restriction endonuclease subunit S [Flavobacterium saccharophilum]|uniref:Type I restriction enzyme, S subunit n=1 Tax=Flavobacterium saccharophilum TaxID=29534 RepID=A0A1M7DES4_9FLAO|nr:restriction endonuclease subunit S [Flavobacterium saccharophilum]SHL77883.1 type I restriction enzyme, S subunit [Flavobacterium saccharophilum]